MILESRQNAPLPKIRGARRLAEWMIALAVIGVVAFFLLLPATRSGRESPNRVQCRRNLIAIGRALQQYHLRYDSFPPAYTTDESGRPLHSWRTLILPFLGNAEREIYKKIDLSEPWDDVTNRRARETPLAIYHCPSHTFPAAKTSYLGIAMDDGVFAPGKTRSMSDLKRGASNIILVVDAGEKDAVEWMSPCDAEAGVIEHIAGGAGSPHTGSIVVLRGDGGVSYTPLSTPEIFLRHLPIDGEPLPMGEGLY